MKFSNPAAAECFERGNAALGRYDLPAAKAAFRQCVELAPESTDAWCHLGMALSAREPVAAAEALDRALALDPNHHGALYWRAEIHWLEGNPSAAAKHLRHLNNIVPGVSHNLAREGLAHLAAGDTHEAKATFTRAVDAGGGLKAVKRAPVELRRAFYLDLLGRRTEAGKLIQRVNGGGPVSRYSRASYPRDLAEQRRALERIVAGRDIAILASGPSLAELPPLLAELGAEGCRDLCFFGFNNVPVAERLLQEAVGRHIDVALMTSAAVMDLHSGWISQFLQRTSPASIFCVPASALTPGRATTEMIKAHEDRLFYFAATGNHPPIPEDPLHFPPVNTLMCVLPLAVLGRPRNIFLFGCDGAAPSVLEKGDGPVYFRQGSQEYGKQNVQNLQYAKWLARDTFFFNSMISTVLQCLSVLHTVSVPPIYLCNPESAYRPFPRIGGGQFLALHRDRGKAQADSARAQNWMIKVGDWLAGRRR